MKGETEKEVWYCYELTFPCFPLSCFKPVVLVFNSLLKALTMFDLTNFFKKVFRFKVQLLGLELRISLQQVYACNGNM